MKTSPAGNRVRLPRSIFGLCDKAGHRVHRGEQGLTRREAQEGQLMSKQPDVVLFRNPQSERRTGA